MFSKRLQSVFPNKDETEINLQISSPRRNIWLKLIWHSLFFFRHIVNYKTLLIAQPFSSWWSFIQTQKAETIYLQRNSFQVMFVSRAHAFVWVNLRVLNEAIVCVKSLVTSPPIPLQTKRLVLREFCGNLWRDASTYFKNDSDENEFRKKKTFVNKEKKIYSAMSALGEASSRLSRARKTWKCSFL